MDITAGRKLLKFVDAQMPELYDRVERRTGYPDQDNFNSMDKFDIAVDRAELAALSGLITEEE